MVIKKDLPFETCENCEQFVMDINEQVIFTDKFMTRQLTVGCKNAYLCRKLLERHGVQDAGKSSEKPL